MTPNQVQEAVKTGVEKILKDQFRKLELLHRAGDISGILRGKTGYVWIEDLKRLAASNPENWRNNLMELS